MVEGTIKDRVELDGEWVDLILYAMEIGISVQEIQEFFRKHKMNETETV
ncbi:anti-repressor SinI family protein [Bacillus sp. PS06]|nr:anti-repressor SinI family protein [Bacillus sp. PS06]MBD8071123.1 anti-repressor SinI family protein [Bacillus sp. PS06]